MSSKTDHDGPPWPLPSDSPLRDTNLYEYLGQPEGRRRYRDVNDHDAIYEFDPMHDHIEAYQRRGKKALHIGVLDSVTLKPIGDAERGRDIGA